MKTRFHFVLRGLILFSAVIFLFVISGCGDDGENITPATYSLSGKVTAADSTTPVSNAVCALDYQSLTVQTDENGNYGFPGLPSGTYRLRISKDNYVPVNMVITVTASNVENISLISIDDWPSVMGDYAYDASSGYILIHVRYKNYQVSNSYPPVEDVVVSKEPSEYKALGYVRDDGIVDWEANDTYTGGQAFFYGVTPGKTYTVKASKDGHNFDDITDVSPVSGEIVSHVLWGSEAAGDVPQQMSNNSFLISSYNSDGTLASNPVIYEGTETVNGITYVKKKLTSGSTITFNKKSYTVYSSVPDYMTIASAYKSKNINSGNASTISTASGDKTSIYSGDPIQLALNEEGSEYYIPNLPNTAGHNGLTENVAWTVDPYANISTYTPSSTHGPQHGWAFDSEKLQFAITWNKLDSTGGNDSGSVTLQDSTSDHLIDSIKGTYDPNQISPLIDSSYPFPDPTTWLKEGAFVNYQPIPGFQVNFLRTYTPWGAWTLLQNTCGLFVRKGGGVELPLDSTNTPYPLVAQTWDSQQFTVLNLTDGPVPATNDQYPGDEKYYMGNTYLPGEAGVVTKWLHYPSNPMANQPDERDSDGWLGFKNDKQEDVMAWNDAGGDLGGQGRKPYMIGAAEYSFSPPLKFRVEHSNSFWYNRVSDSSSHDNMYKISYYVDPGSGTYYKLGEIWWTWYKDTDFGPVANDSGYAFPYSYCWKGASDGSGCWAAHATWTYNDELKSSGWVHDLTLGTHTLAGPGGASISLKCTRADLFSAVAPGEEITWNEADTFADNSPSTQSVVYKYTFTGSVPDDTIKFLAVLEDI